MSSLSGGSVVRKCSVPTVWLSNLQSAIRSGMGKGAKETIKAFKLCVFYGSSVKLNDYENEYGTWFKKITFHCCCLTCE